MVETNQPARSPRPLWIFIGLFFLVWTLRATVLYSLDLAIPSELGRRVYSNALKLALWVAPALLYLRLVERANPWRALRLDRLPRGRALLIAAGANLLYLGFLLATQSLNAFHAQGLAALLGALTANVVSPLSEEILFRGLVLQQLAQSMPFWQANLLQALLFSMAHWPNWLWTDGLSLGRVATAVSVGVFGWAAGYLLRLTGSLWPGVVAHVLNNLIPALFG